VSTIRANEENTMSTGTFECQTCHDHFLTKDPQADECGYCRARRESDERAAAGLCAYGCKVLDNECTAPATANSRCDEHQAKVAS
jgi:hypothetical protein